MTIEEARAVLVGFDGAVGGEHMGHPDFRVGGKIFATLWPTQDRSVLRLPPSFAESLLREDQPELKIVSKSGGMAWLSVPLEETSREDFEIWSEIALLARRAKRE